MPSQGRRGLGKLQKKQAELRLGPVHMREVWWGERKEYWGTGSRVGPLVLLSKPVVQRRGHRGYMDALADISCVTDLGCISRHLVGDWVLCHPGQN